MVGIFGNIFGGVNPPNEVIVGATNGVGADGTATAGGGGYPLLNPNYVLEGVDLGDGSKGKYRVPDLGYYLTTGPGYGVSTNLTYGSAVLPPAVAILAGWISRKGGIDYPGRYYPPAKAYYLSSGPGYGVDGQEAGTASASGTPAPSTSRNRNLMIFSRNNFDKGGFKPLLGEAIGDVSSSALIFKNAPAKCVGVTVTVRGNPLTIRWDGGVATVTNGNDYPVDTHSFEVGSTDLKKATAIGVGVTGWITYWGPQ